MIKHKLIICLGLWFLFHADFGIWSFLTNWKDVQLPPELSSLISSLDVAGNK